MTAYVTNEAKDLNDIRLSSSISPHEDIERPKVQRKLIDTPEIAYGNTRNRLHLTTCASWVRLLYHSTL